MRDFDVKTKVLTPYTSPAQLGVLLCGSAGALGLRPRPCAASVRCVPDLRSGPGPEVAGNTIQPPLVRDFSYTTTVAS